MLKRSQSSLEFLVNFALIILLIALISFVLVSFGIINPDQFLPRETEAGTTAIIMDSTVNQDSVTLFVQNDLGKTANNFQVNITECNISGSISSGVSIFPGETKEIIIPCNHSLSVGKRLDSILKISYTTKEGDTVLSHISIGTIRNDVTHE